MSDPVLVDTDPGIDDTLALHYLVATGGWDLKAITAVAGNVPLPRAVANVRGLAALLGIERDVPMYGGCPKPLMRALETAQHVHGDDGMGGAVNVPGNTPLGVAEFSTSTLTLKPPGKWRRAVKSSSSRTYTTTILPGCLRYAVSR